MSVSFNTTHDRRRRELAGTVLVLLLVAWLYWHSPLTAPPGLEMDELIEAQIAEQVLQGDLRPFYEAGQGREGLYYYWLAGWLVLLGRRAFTLRIASTTLSLLGLSAGYTLMRRLLGGTVALIGLAVGGASFWVLFAARSGLRSTGLPLLAALAGYFFWRGISPSLRGSERIRFLLGAGLCLGLTFYTYTAARVLPAIFVLFVFYLLIFHRRQLSGHVMGLLLSGLATLLTVLPLLLYMSAHPEVDQFDFLDFNRPLAALQSGDPQPALQTSLATLGMFVFRGDPLIFDNVPLRPVFDPFMGLFFLAGVLIAIIRFRNPPYAFILIWLLVSLLPGMLSQPAPNFYRTVSAQVVTFAFPALAMAELGNFVHRRWPERYTSWVWSSGLIALLAIHLGGSWRAYFVTWPGVEGIRFFWQTGLSETAQYLDDVPDDSPVAICTELTYEYDAWWRPAWQSMPYLLAREALAPRYVNCRNTLVFPASESVRYIFLDTSDPAELLPDQFRGHWLAQAAPIPDIFPPGQGVALRVEHLPYDLIPDSGMAWIAPEAGSGPVALPVEFGSSLAFLGYERSPAHPNPGEPLRLMTAWEVRGIPPPRLVLFTHLLTDPQTVVGQQDSLALTSHSLQPGDHFLVMHDQVYVPADGPIGEYLLAIGIYSSDTMLRLPIYHGGQTCSDRLFLEPVEVRE